MKDLQNVKLVQIIDFPLAGVQSKSKKNSHKCLFILFFLFLFGLTFKLIPVSKEM